MRWINAFVHRPREAGDLHTVFSDGTTLCSMIERLRPGTRLVRFHRAVTRGTASANLEAALTLVWKHRPQASAMPSPAQLLDGAPRNLVLRFIDQLYTIFVVRPAQTRIGAALRLVDGLLAPYSACLTAGTLHPPHATLGHELRTCTAIAITLHTCLPAGRRSADLERVYWQPKSEAERQRSVRAVFEVLERERLAPCSADEFLAAAKPAKPASGGGRAEATALEAELLTILLAAVHQRFAISGDAGNRALLEFGDASRLRPLPGALPASSAATDDEAGEWLDTERLVMLTTG